MSAIKRVNLRGLKNHEVEAIELEFKLLEAIQHPNVVRLLGHYRAFEHLHIVLEFMDGGALAGVKAKKYSSEEVQRFAAGMLAGLACLHSKGVVHRDIKGANLLVNQKQEVKLTDFGVAAELIGDIGALDAVGTPYWMAPEVIQQLEQSTAVDIWSAGCTVVELLTGKPPNYELNPMAAMYHIVEKEIELQQYDPLLRDFLSQCFVKEPEKRATAEALLKHDWLGDFAKQEVPVSPAQEKARLLWKAAGAAVGKFNRSKGSHNYILCISIFSLDSLIGEGGDI